MQTKSYTVHLSHVTSDDGLVLIKEGFCWLAFAFSVPWALFYRMWGVAGAFALLQVSIFIVFNVTTLEITGQWVALFAVALIFGFLADDLRRHALARQGYYIEEIIVEQNIDKAARRFLVARSELLSKLAAQI